MDELFNRLGSLDLKHVSLVETISRTITEAILHGIFKEGEQLIETDLMKQFNISRSPIREAFRVLEKQDLVEVMPRKGAFVKRISRRDIDEHFPVRSVLEGLAAKEAYKKFTTEDIQEMAKALENMKKALEKKDPRLYYEHHFTFHQVYIEACDNQLLARLLEPLRMHGMWYRFLFRYYDDDFKKLVETHEEILELFENKKSGPEKIEKTIRKHFEKALDKFLLYFDEMKSDESSEK